MDLGGSGSEVFIYRDTPVRYCIYDVYMIPKKTAYKRPWIVLAYLFYVVPYSAVSAYLVHSVPVYRFTWFTTTLRCLTRCTGSGWNAALSTFPRSWDKYSTCSVIRQASPPFSLSVKNLFRGSGFNQVSASVSGSGPRRAKNYPHFEVLDVLFWELKASSVAWTSFLKA